MIESSETHAGFAEVNGAKLYYEESGEGHPLLLLHAGVADSRMWDDQFGVFAQHYKVIRYDLRGFGKSAMPPGLFSSHEDVAGLLDFLNIEKAYVIGQSFGGYIAIDFTLAHPEMVEALILGAPNVSGYEPSSEEVQRFCTEEEEALNRGDLAGATELNLCMWVDGPNRTPDQVNPAVRERVREMQLHVFSLPEPEGVEEQPLTPPAINRLGEIRVPTLVIVGDQDVPEFLKISDIVVAGIAGAEKVVIPGAAHLPNMEKPKEFNRLVLDFLNRRVEV
ncbi:MAG: alpha/beta fold hydrolase [Anaerolineae bacterium]|nr:alpha/beta fold hydrolase [Anaerolineae bacterium]